jgi:hypothetical protein
MRARVLLVACLLIVCAAASARAQGVAIDHKEVGCIVVGKYPKMNACFSPASSLARSRVYFRPEGTPSWYYVEMKSDQPCFAGVLPRPGKKLVGKKIEYYVEAQDKSFNPARTSEYGPVVVQSAQECKKDVPVAPFVNNATVAVFPGLPAGFVGGGIGTAAVVGVAAAGAAAAGTAAVVASSDDDTTTTTTIVAGVNTTTTLAAVTTTTTTTVPPRANRAPFAVLTTNPDPASGQSPLTVTFDLCKSTDPDGDPLSFFFDFGDGATATGSCLESHTYTAPFRGTSGAVVALDAAFTASARVVDPGGLSAERNRPVSIGSPEPSCAAPTVTLGPVPPDANGCPARIPVRATTTDADSVQFCAEIANGNQCQRSQNVTDLAAVPTCVAGVRSGDTFTATLRLPDNSFNCFRITADATGCGGSATSNPDFTFQSGCGFLPAAAVPAGDGITSWASDLAVDGGRLQVTVNGAAPAFPGRGRGLGRARLVDGENRLEAVLVEAAGRAGTWRIELTPAEAILEGSLRVVSGEVVSLGATSATFRLGGRAGERVVLTFLRK